MLSGGLDSLLAVKVLREQGIETTGLTFTGCFFGARKARQAAENLGIKLLVKNFSRSHLALVKNPPHGYGKNMNPCIDCHALMLKRAKKEMIRGGFDFVATGEVFGQRPMSQNRQSLKTVERESGLAGFLLRPLSAKLLEKTVPEKNGLVDREKLLSFEGRGRRPQFRLAEKYGIKSYANPAGGCLLTDPAFSGRLKDLLEKNPKAGPDEMALLKFGRHLWQGEILFVVGRDHRENLALKKLAQKNDLLVEARDFPGPTVLARSQRGAKMKKETVADEIGKLLAKYGKKTREKEVAIKWLG